MVSSEAIVTELYDRVWSTGNYQAIQSLVAAHYAIHSDPGDPWEGQTLDHQTYQERVQYSRSAFPDLVFTVHQTVGTEHHVAVRWSATGTHLGRLRGLSATGKRLTFTGQTIYEVTQERVAGHWQVVDRIGFMHQLRS
jgi:steroid delta-isomerase-like uncharacterized protein